MHRLLIQSLAKQGELGEAMLTRTVTAGGAVTIVDAHAALGTVGGVAARLRFAL